MKTTLVIMAAGLGSRYGGGIKQLEPVGPDGEIIMDYSIHDAIEAGFDKVIFIIRRDIYEDFLEAIGNRIKKICDRLHVEVSYAFQDLTDLPEGVQMPEGRTKPWGTGQAVLSCRDQIHEPFAVINADDYYGKDAFVSMHAFLEACTPDRPYDLCMAGFILKNTLSENGGVTRGICCVEEDDYLTNVIETQDLVRKNDREASGVEKGINGSKKQVTVPLDARVSMNMWGLTPEFVDVLSDGFRQFFSDIKGNELDAEYLLPIYIGQLLQEKKVRVKVLETADKWFGVTFREDKALVVDSFRRLTEDGVYQKDLFGDL